eukprot:CAMPEP_0170455786 /NCGR_PEP_ID=MMETSP0123-20130129/3630_1 /TAXON_ID=182087 /ORGANISM="Favella ehrenbergii, Strain Fehren 1" /LENGTH=148 /DNA_ID=CAMNT_0010719031 /DNA_START=492 /DNA_END=938 /DNA_ORIENTATION=-
MHHVVDGPEVGAVCGTAQENHAQTVSKAGQAFFVHYITHRQVDPNDSHAEDEQYDHAASKLNKRLERVIANAVVRKAAMMIHHKYALFALRAVVYMLSFDDGAVGAALNDYLGPVRTARLQPGQTRDSRLDMLVEGLWVELAGLDDAF